MTKPTTARQLLDVIDQFLVDTQMTLVGADAWAVLVALRMPDNPDMDMQELTAIVRTKAFPLAAMQGQPILQPTWSRLVLTRFSNTTFAHPHSDLHLPRNPDTGYYIFRAAEAFDRIDQEKTK